MAEALETDFKAPYDLTAYNVITGAQLSGLVDGAIVEDDKGLIVTTADSGETIYYPDANTTVKWQRYIWRRVTASAVFLYIWNPYATLGTLQRWVAINEASLADGSITNAKLGAASVTDDKVASVAWSKITGLPDAFELSGAASGDLTGNYPNPSIAANAVDSTKLSSSTTDDDDRAVGPNHIKDEAIDPETHLNPTGYSAYDMLRVASDLSGWEAASILIAKMTNPVAADALKLVRVKSDASGFEMVTPTTTGANSYPIAAKAIAPTTTTTTTPAIDDSVPIVSEGDELVSIAFTPKSSTTLLKITLNGFVGGGGTKFTFALFTGASANALRVQHITTDSSDHYTALHIEHVMASPGTTAVTISIRWGVNSGTGYFGTNGSFGAVDSGMFIIEEVEGAIS